MGSGKKKVGRCLVRNRLKVSACVALDIVSLNGMEAVNIIAHTLDWIKRFLTKSSDLKFAEN